MPYPRFCPGCGLNTSSHGAITEVQEMYNQTHVSPVNPDELVGEEKEICGDNVRAFCKCGFEFYNEKDEVYRTRDVIAGWFAKVVGLDVSYVINDATSLVKRQMEAEGKEEDRAARAQWDAADEEVEGSDPS